MGGAGGIIGIGGGGGAAIIKKSWTLAFLRFLTFLGAEQSSLHALGQLPFLASAHFAQHSHFVQLPQDSQHAPDLDFASAAWTHILQPMASRPTSSCTIGQGVGIGGATRGTGAGTITAGFS
jgi:hypothetical protein